jgi:methyltransferase-like protein
MKTNTHTLNISADGFAFDSATGESYTLNPCAHFIMEKLQKQQTKQQIISDITSEFGIPQSIIERDVNDFMQQLHFLGIIRGDN